MAETIYGVLRKKNLYVYLAQHGSGVPERRLAILGFAAPRDFLHGALTDQEQTGCRAATRSSPSDLMELHRHNLPQWLVEPLKDAAGRRLLAAGRKPQCSRPGWTCASIP